MKRIVGAGAIAVMISSSVFAQSDAAFVLGCTVSGTRSAVTANTYPISETITLTIDPGSKEFGISSGVERIGRVRHGKITEITSHEYILWKWNTRNTVSFATINRTTGAYREHYNSAAYSLELNGPCHKTNAPVPKPKF